MRHLVVVHLAVHTTVVGAEGTGQEQVATWWVSGADTAS
jgi:hypothetical protein